MIAYIALGGILGTLARRGGRARTRRTGVGARGGTFPTGTLAINIAGSFLLGFIIRFATGSAVVSPELRGGLTIGFCGAFTTMSTFSYESVRLLADGEYWYAGLYAGGTVLGCLVATVAGLALASKLL
jgi:CrcB protein